MRMRRLIRHSWRLICFAGGAWRGQPGGAGESVRLIWWRGCSGRLNDRWGFCRGRRLRVGRCGDSRAFVVRDEKQAMALLNDYAPEHLILACREPSSAGRMRSSMPAPYSWGIIRRRALAIMRAGPIMCLPTNGHARAYSGVSVDSFVKKITFQQLSGRGWRGSALTVMRMAEAEGLEAHARAVGIRLEEGASAAGIYWRGVRARRYIVGGSIIYTYVFKLCACLISISFYGKISGRWCLIHRPGTTSRVRRRYFLDANENSLGSPLTRWYNRYPDPHQWKVKEALAKIKGMAPAAYFLGQWER